MSLLQHCPTTTGSAHALCGVRLPAGLLLGRLKAAIATLGVFVSFILSATWSLAGSAHAQTPQAHSNFTHIPRSASAPANAPRGRLHIGVNGHSFELGEQGHVLRPTPGFRLYDPMGRIIFAHSVAGQTFHAAWALEPSTGGLHTAWILGPWQEPLWQGQLKTTVSR